MITVIMILKKSLKEYTEQLSQIKWKLHVVCMTYQIKKKFTTVNIIRFSQRLKNIVINAMMGIVLILTMVRVQDVFPMSIQEL